MFTPSGPTPLRHFQSIRGPVHNASTSVREGEPPPNPMTAESDEANSLLRSVRLKVASRDAEAIRRARWTMIDGPAARNNSNNEPSAPSTPDFNTLPRRSKPNQAQPLHNDFGAPTAMGDVNMDVGASTVTGASSSGRRSPLPPAMVGWPPSAPRPDQPAPPPPETQGSEEPTVGYIMAQPC